MGQALSDTVVLGVTTNVPYLQETIRHPEFRRGHTHTRFLEENLGGWQPSSLPTDEEWLALAAFESLSAIDAMDNELASTATATWRDPWSVAEAWRNVP